MTRTATWSCRTCETAGWHSFMLTHQERTGHEIYEQRWHRTKIGDRPRIGEPVWVPGVCSDLPDETFDDDRAWPRVKSIVHNVRGPAGYFLVWLSIGRANVWIERHTDPNGDNPYWYLDGSEVGRLGLGAKTKRSAAR